MSLVKSHSRNAGIRKTHSRWSHKEEDIKRFMHFWPFVRGIDWSSLVSTHKCLVTWIVVFYFLFSWKTLWNKGSGCPWLETPSSSCGVELIMTKFIFQFIFVIYAVCITFNALYIQSWCKIITVAGKWYSQGAQILISFTRFICGLLLIHHCNFQLVSYIILLYRFATIFYNKLESFVY